MDIQQISFKDSNSLLKAYQQNIANIYKQRKKITHNINEKSKQKRMIYFEPENPRLREKKSQFDQFDNLRKLVKTPSQVKFEQNLEPKKEQKIIQVPQAITDRNRRIFGGLTTYLKKAGEHLRSKQQKQKQLHTKEILNKVISKEKQQKQDLENKQKQQVQIQLSKLQQQKKQNEQKMNKAQNQLLSFIVKSHFNAIGKFYLTKTEPKLFWRPNKILDDADRAQKMRQYGQKQLKKQQQEIIEKVISYNEIFDLNKFMTQNQRQFYSSFIKNMYRDHRSFISTKAQPSIFWKPKKQFKGVSKLMSQSSLKLNEKSNMYQIQNNEYCKTRQVNFIEDQNKEYSDVQEVEQKNE